MPPGAKKRKALKKKQQQQEATGTSTNSKGSTNGDNLNGNDEHGSQGDRESDSNLSSPGSQGNDEFGGTKEISDAAITVERVTDDKKSTVSSNENTTQTAKNVASQDSCGDSIKEISPAVDSVKPVVSVSKVVIPEKSEHAETSTHPDLVENKSGENKEHPSTGLEKENGKVAALPGSAVGTSRNVESVRASDVSVSSEEKRLLLAGPPAVRTSWLSCCGLFDAMTGSDR